MKKLTNSLNKIFKSLLSLLLILCMLGSIFPATSAFAFGDENGNGEGDHMLNSPAPEGEGAIPASEEFLFDKNNAEDITLELPPGSSSLLNIIHGNYTLVEGMDYTMINNTITIKAWFLATLPAGVQPFIFEMSDGVNPVISVTIIDGPLPWDQTMDQSQEQGWKQNNLPFSDIPETSLFYSDVEYVFSHGLMNGLSYDSFSPNTPLTRAMIANILYNHAGQPDASGWKNQFVDVSDGKYYTDAITWAMENGIMIGYGGGFFGTNDPLTREQLATILVRYADTLWMTLPEWRESPVFSDAANISDYAQKALIICYRAGLIDYKSGSIIDPKGTVTRAETASIIYKFLETT